MKKKDEKSFPKIAFPLAGLFFMISGMISLGVVFLALTPVFINEEEE